MSKKNEDNKEEPIGETRQTWGNEADFLMSCIATSVGLGNIWRFPSVAYSHGGGAYLIPYVIVLFLVGIPIYFLEMVLGQFTGRNNVEALDYCPLFRGIGLGVIISCLAIVTYYSALIGIIFHFFTDSFHHPLPWGKCHSNWENCLDSEGSFRAATIKTSAELYFYKEILHESKTPEKGLGLPSLDLSLYLLITWVTIFIVIVRGVRGSGKFAYFLALFPYCILIILFIRSVTLEGASNGILFFLTPQWDLLLTAEVWYAATTQLFFSLTVGNGPIIVFSSYNKFTHNIFRDVLCITILDTVTSFLAGVTIFGILGNLAMNVNETNIANVIDDGAGIAFISYPDAIAKSPFWPNLFAVLFFFMLFVLGIGSCASLVTVCVTILRDFTLTRCKKLRYWHCALTVCIFGYSGGLVYTTPCGQWVLNLVDFYGATMIVFVLTTCQVCAVNWIYGLEKICWDVEYMTGRTIGPYWRICWGIVTPIILISVFIYSMINLKPLQYGPLDYPLYLTIIGWAIFIIAMIQIVVWMIVQLTYINREDSCKERFRNSLKPSERWGPKLPDDHQGWIEFRQKAIDNRIKLSENHSWCVQKLCMLFNRYKME